MAVSPCTACGSAAAGGGATCSCVLVYDDGAAVPGGGVPGNPYVITRPDVTSNPAGPVAACTVTGSYDMLAYIGATLTRVTMPCIRRYRLV